MFVGVLATPLERVQHECNRKSCNMWNRRRLLNKNIATWKSATWNSAIHKKSTTRKMWYMKKLLHKHCTKKEVFHQGFLQKKNSMKIVQHEKSSTWRNINCHSEILKKCTRIVPYSAQTDNGPSVDGPLYIGLELQWSVPVNKICLWLGFIESCKETGIDEALDFWDLKFRVSFDIF